MTHDRPTPAELLEAVREFMAGEILPMLDDHRLKFRTLVAMNVTNHTVAWRRLIRDASLQDQVPALHTSPDTQKAKSPTA